jgi:membrane-bound lytic murein transglycosylase D
MVVNNNNPMKQPPAPAFPLSARTSFSTRLKKLLAALMFLAIFLSSPFAAQASEHFPVFPSIITNVRFWEDVYSRYTTSQGVLHDQDNLAIVYTVVNLVGWDTRGSARINKKRIKLARQHYKSILAALASGKKPTSEDEKRVAKMFSGVFREEPSGFQKGAEQYSAPDRPERPFS